MQKTPALYCLCKSLAAASFAVLVIAIFCGTRAVAVEVDVVPDDTQTAKATDCRRVLIGPGVNQPDPHPGYYGTIAWDTVIQLKDGTLLVSFSTGYWHASPPTPLRIDPETLSAWRKAGMPTDIDAPRGGRAMIIRSTDNGLTWSKPETIIDTPWDDRSPALVELPSGVILCSLFTYPGATKDPVKHPDLVSHVVILRSTDGGKTWEKNTQRLPSPFIGEATDNPPLVLKDGSVVLAVYGRTAPDKPEQIAFFRSTDDGQTWKLLSTVENDHEMSEMGLAQLPDGRLVMISRSEGDIVWSSNLGQTWTKPESFGMRMFEPKLMVLRDGTLLCLHGSYCPTDYGLRVIFSRDGGKTWIAPARDHGFAVDPKVYGYGHAEELPDGSILVVYIYTGCHSPHDAQRGTLFMSRFRIRPDYKGIELLPAPGLKEASAPKATPRPSASVLIGPDAPPLERFAADELCSYLKKLYKIDIQPITKPNEATGTTFIVGAPSTNPAVAESLVTDSWPEVSDQGIVLKRAPLDGKPALVVGGGSPRATLWAVYDLVERWGVRYLLRGDVLPEKPGELRLPNEDVVNEPLLRVRQWRTVNDFANGPESWGIKDHRPLLDQLAKLKFNNLFLSTMTYQPFLNPEVRGIKRKWGTLWYDHRLPITPDMIGRELYGDVKEFWNPDLPDNKDYEAFAAAGEKLMHDLIAHAHARGMQCVMTASLNDYSPEFAPLLKDYRKVQQLVGLTIVPGPDTPPDDPALTELAAAVLQTTVNTYPELDYIRLHVPEQRQWVERYKEAWQALDERYGIGEIRSLDEVLAATQLRKEYPGGVERALVEVKGDLVGHYFNDRLIRQLRVLDGTRRPDIKFMFSGGAEELYPLLERILPQGSELLSFVDYTPSRIVKRKAVLAHSPGGRTFPSSLIFTLEDDNIGPMPQLTTGSLHQLTDELIRHGWSGFSTRYWITGGHDPCVAYIARAAWDRDVTPEQVYRDQISAVYGEACVDDMLEVFREVEKVTISLEWHNLTFAFPVPDSMLNFHWSSRPMSPELVQNRCGYSRALEAAQRAQEKVSDSGGAYVDYWVGRLESGIEYINAVESLRRAAKADRNDDGPEAIRQLESAIAAAKRSISAFARVATDQSDRGAVAQLNEFVYRSLKRKLVELREKYGES